MWVFPNPVTNTDFRWGGGGGGGGGGVAKRILYKNAGDTHCSRVYSFTGLDYWTDLFYYGNNQFSSVDWSNQSELCTFA